MLSEHSVPTFIMGHKHNMVTICLSIPSLKKGTVFFILYLSTYHSVWWRVGTKYMVLERNH